jgi:hypothetical protein
MCAAARRASDLPLLACQSAVLARIGRADTSLVPRAVLRLRISQSIGAERAFIGGGYQTLMAADTRRGTYTPSISQRIGAERAFIGRGYQVLMAVDARRWVYADAASRLGRKGHWNKSLASRWKRRRQSGHQRASEEFCGDRVHVSSLSNCRHLQTQVVALENHGLSKRFPGLIQSSLPRRAGSPPSAAMFWHIDCSTQNRAR